MSDVHASSIVIAVDATTAMAFMADGLAQGRWALGSWDRERTAGGAFVGRSLFTGDRLVVRLDVDTERALVDYHVGADEDSLQHRVQARVIPGPVLGHPEGSSVVTLLVWRDTTTTDEKWALNKASFDTEVHMIRGLLEGRVPAPGR